MSAEYEGKDLNQIAAEAEQDVNSRWAKEGHRADDDKAAQSAKYGASDSTKESGVDEAVVGKFPGADVTVGSAASGTGDNREIPLEEGGSINPKTGQLYKAGDFEGVGGPEDQARANAEANPGSDDVRDNIRMQKQ